MRPGVTVVPTWLPKCISMSQHAPQPDSPDSSEAPSPSAADPAAPPPRRPAGSPEGQPPGRDYRPKYLTVKQFIADRIRTGRFQVGQRIPSQHELVQSCGVSGNTCKRAIQSLIEDGVLEGQQGRGVFVRSTLGRSDVRQIALVAWSDAALAQHPAFTETVNGLMRALAETHYQLNFCFLDPERLHAEEMQARLAGIHAAGIIVTHTPRDVQDALQPLTHKQVPIVCIGREMSALSPNAVLTDNAGALQRVVQGALEAHVRRIAFVGCPVEEIYQRRMAVFQRCFARAGRSIDELIVRRGEATHQTGRDLMGALLNESAEPPQLVIADDDYVAQGALETIRAADLRVPDDVQVLGIGGFLNRWSSLPELATLSVPFSESGQAAGDMVLRLIEQQSVETPAPVLPCPIQTRGTFDVPLPTAPAEASPDASSPGSMTAAHVTSVSMPSSR